MIGNLKDYLNNRITLLKLEVVEGIGKGLAKITSILILAIFSFFSYFFLTFGVAWYIGKHHLDGDLPLGFIIVGVFHLIILLIVLLFRKILLEKFMLNFFISAAFNSKNNEDDN